MSKHQIYDEDSLFSRRKLLKVGLAGVSIAGTAAVGRKLLLSKANTSVKIPLLPEDLPNLGNNINPMAICREFDYGTVKQENGRLVREFQITANITHLQLNSLIEFPAWTYNSRVPGPTLRAIEGDWVRVIFSNQAGHPHTMHFHGIHSAEMDGVKPPVSNNKSFIYEFEALPYGLHLYHCHIPPVTEHISKGLHGMFIIDPKQGRPPADEIVMVMGGYDIQETKESLLGLEPGTLDDNEHTKIYAFNGIPDYLARHPLPIYQNQLVRIYLLNTIEFVPSVTFHIHANFFEVYPTGMTLRPTQKTDVITMGMAERHILEFTYSLPGQYMFHPHQDDIAEAGCMGRFTILQE